MFEPVAARLARLKDAGLAGLLKRSRVGLEKEGLRVGGDGYIAQTPHPSALGSALKHPYITTDYSEALLELITPAFVDKRAPLAFLGELHQFVYRHIGDELLWGASMPCRLAGETSVPIAHYGSSNSGMMKTIYRRGLGHRYGRVMQVIAGVHFNFSFDDAFWEGLHTLEESPLPLQEFIAERYFGVLRNLQRLGWLVPYLFGSSPAVCKSFLDGKETRLAEFDQDTYYGPYATSLRMGDIGYQNNKEFEIGVKACYDGLEEYVDTLSYAINTAYPGYEQIGVQVAGEWRQLNANILQIENEYYSTVRPKQLLEGNEKPTVALLRRGVRYFELRSLDVNVWHPLGVSEPQLRFLELLSCLCLLAESPRIRPWERAEIDNNELAVAHHGREPGLQLMRDGSLQRLTDWGEEVCMAMLPLCELLDQDEAGAPYATALAEQRAALADPSRTPSAQVLAEMRAHGEGYYDFARRKALEHRQTLLAQPVDSAEQATLTALAERSLAEQHQLEAEEQEEFGSFLARYFAQGQGL